MNKFSNTAFSHRVRANLIITLNPHIETTFMALFSFSMRSNAVAVFSLYPIQNVGANTEHSHTCRIDRSEERKKKQKKLHKHIAMKLKLFISSMSFTWHVFDLAHCSKCPTTRHVPSARGPSACGTMWRWFWFGFFNRNVSDAFWKIQFSLCAIRNRLLVALN